MNREPHVHDWDARLFVLEGAPEETFVLFDDNEPVGTANLVTIDLPSGPDLTPWVAQRARASPFRGKAYSGPLGQHVEAAAQSAAVLWLYTWTAEPVYARLGREDLAGALELEGIGKDDPRLQARLDEHRRNGGKLRVGLGGRGVRIIFSREADLRYWQQHYGQRQAA